ncbi:MAG: hypothetical protein EZS28_040679, partial [Streblomastix strix]
MLAHLCEQQEDNLAMGILNQMIHYLIEAERTQFAIARNENGTNANYFNLAANSVNQHLSSEAGSHMLGAQVIARSDTANKTAIGITNLLFGILQLGKARVKTKRFRQPTPSAIWREVMGPMLYQNENQALEQNQEIQNQANIRRYATSELRTARLASARSWTEIPGIPNVLTKETIKNLMHKCVPHVTDQRKAKQQGQTPSMDDIRAFWRKYNFDLRVACVRKEYNSEDDSETLQPTKTTRREFRNKFGRNRNRSLSPHSKRQRQDSPDRRSESRERAGSRSYSRPREFQSSRETTDKSYNGFETRNESRGRGRGTYRGRGYNYQGKGSNYQDRDQLNQERYRDAQKYNPHSKQAFNKTKNPINWNRTHQYEDKNRGEGWDDNPNDDWTKRTQMQKDPPENHSDRDSIWTEDEAPQHHVATPQPKQPAQQTQTVHQIQVQPKQQVQPRYQKRKREQINHRIKTTLTNRKQCRKDQLYYRKRKNNIIYLTQRISGT